MMDHESRLNWASDSDGAEVEGSFPRKTIKDRTTRVLEGIKDDVREVKKSKMRVGSFFFCDKCDTPIYNEEDGFVIHGNIYKADATSQEKKGVIGNNLPEELKRGDKILASDIKETVLCITCIKIALKINDVGTPEKPPKVKVKKKGILNTL